MAETGKKYHIEKNTVQETLIIPLYGRKVCSDHYPELFQDPEAERICSMLDYDFAEKGAKMMTKTWIKEAGISDVNAYFSIEDKSELESWSKDFVVVTARSYMRGYRDIYKDVKALHKLMIRFSDTWVKMQIIKIAFREK